MTKRDVRAAIGWVALALFSPLFGAFLYLVAGVNRVRQSKMAQLRDAADPLIDRANFHSIDDENDPVPLHLRCLLRLGDEVSQFPLLMGNRVTPLSGGDEAYPAMLEGIRKAKRTVALGSYIFDNDAIGRQFVEALADARARGVEIRVLIDSIGARYSRPTIRRPLRKAGIRVGLFMSDMLGLRLPYANLRSHRKVLVIDGVLGFTGGMNIRAGFMKAYSKGQPAHDAHFRVEGPAVAQLMTVFAHDWEFTTRESLQNSLWFPATQAYTDGVPVRVVASGPDRNLGRTRDMLLGAFSVAQHHIRLQTPYFLPDVTLISALTIAAQRGVEVDVVIPGNNNLRLVDCAMTAQLDQLVEKGVRIWRVPGEFDHAKLLTIDGAWSYVGSSNLDSRSLRLNFELDMEVHDIALAQSIENRIDSAIEHAHRQTLEQLAGKPFFKRLRNKIIWLASPYL